MGVQVPWLKTQSEVTKSPPGEQQREQPPVPTARSPHRYWLYSWVWLGATCVTGHTGSPTGPVLCCALSARSGWRREARRLCLSIHCAIQVSFQPAPLPLLSDHCCCSYCAERHGCKVTTPGATIPVLPGVMGAFWNCVL